MNLHSDIQHLLARFEARRRTLLLVRGGLAGGAALVIAGSLWALTDNALFVEDSTRNLAALAIYGATAATIWLRAGRLIREPRSPEKTAARVEQTLPELGGTLLSAVELSRPSERDSDSQQFRILAQERAATLAVKINTHQALPWRLIRRDAQVALCTATLLAVFCAIDYPHFGLRFLRGLLPFAEIEVPSNTRITILNPSPNEGVVPGNEPLTIIAEIQSPKLQPAELRAVTKSGIATRLPMRKNADGAFQVELPVGMEKLSYRVRSGDGLTRSFELEPQARPTVATFSRLYHPPAYSGLPESKVESTEGSITALEGSEVELVLHSEQTLCAGSLLIFDGQQTHTVRLDPDREDARLLRTRLPLTRSGSYRVHLTSATSQLGSAKGPQYEIRVVPDAPPTITIVTPTQDLLLPLGEKVKFQGTAEDDLGLSAIVQEVQVNRGPWQQISLAPPAGKQTDILQNLDPLEHGLVPGDTLNVRFVVIDSKGQRAESRAVQILIAQPGALPATDASLTLQRNVRKRVAEATRQAELAAKSLSEARIEAAAKSPNMLKKTQSLLRGRQALEAAQENAAAARDTVLEQLKTSDSPEAQADLELQASTLSRAELGLLNPARQALERMETTAKTGAPEAHQPSETTTIREAAENAAKAAALARAVRDAASARLDAMEAESLAQAARALTQEQAVLKEATAAQKTDPAQPESIAGPQDAELRRQQVNQAAAAALQKELKALAERSRTAAAPLHAAGNALKEGLEAMERASRATPPATATPETMAEAARRTTEAGDALTKGLVQTARSLEALKTPLQEALGKSMETLQRDAKPPVGTPLFTPDAPHANTADRPSPSSGAPSVGLPSNSNHLPTRPADQDANWGNLPSQLARDLMEGKRDTAPSEYKSMVDAYFKAVAEKARAGSSRP